MLSAYLAAGACAFQCTGSAKSQHACEGVCHPPAKFGLISWGTLTSYCALTHPCSRAQLTKCFQHTLLQGHVHSSALAQPSHSMLVRVSATHLPSLGSSAGVPLPHTFPLLIPAAARNLLSAFSIPCCRGMCVPVHWLSQVTACL